jgi:hypothetical protein
MSILHRIKQAIARLGGSSAPAIGGGTAGASVDLGQIQALEREEFPPEEFAAGEDEESES